MLTSRLAGTGRRDSGPARRPAGTATSTGVHRIRDRAAVVSAICVASPPGRHDPRSRGSRSARDRRGCSVPCTLGDAVVGGEAPRRESWPGIRRPAVHCRRRRRAGRHRAGRPGCVSSGYRRSSSSAMNGPVTSGGATSRCACMIRSGYDHLYLPFPPTWPVFSRRTRSATGWSSARR